MAAYVPAQGDFVALTLDPQSGHEQRGRRPALVISKPLFNSKTGLAIVCPVTKTKQDYPFHAPISPGMNVTGFVMVEQVKSLDFRTRKAKRIGRASNAVLEEVLSILDACIF